MAREYRLELARAESAGGGIDYRAELNDEQYAAVTSPPGLALVIAGAGSGKTRTLTYRVAYLLDHGVAPESILLLTFTNKAAREMLERVEALVPFDRRRLWGGTFHAIGARLLRRHAEHLGLTRDFSILDRDDAENLVKAIIAAEGVAEGSLRFPKPRVVLELFSLAANASRPLHDILAERYAWHQELEEPLERVWRAYERRKRDANSLDFDDLLLLPLKLFEEQPPVLAEYQQQFRFVLVDEYQDTNAVQARLVDLLAERHGSLMVVGDDAQSIYSWRGAEPENILGFPQRHPDARVFRIETNYRSIPEVLELANEVIGKNTRQFAKALRAVRGSGMVPARVLLGDTQLQAAFVAQRVLELVDEGMELDQLAVLYRSHFHATELQLELTRRNVPYVITSGLRFFEQAHIKDVMAFLKLAANPRDELSFLRIALLFPGIGQKSAEKLWSQWRQRVEARQGTLPVSFRAELEALVVPKKAASAWAQLGYTMEEFLDGRGGLQPPEALIRSVVHGVYEEIAQGQFSNYENRLQELEQLEGMARNAGSLSTFLQETSLLAGADQVESREDADQPRLLLSTVHQAKGLEFKGVFVIWLAEGMFPTRRSIESELEGDPRALEEERRLFYVACTRAEDELYLCYPAYWPNAWGGEVIQLPSRFLEDFAAGRAEEWRVS